MECPQKCKGCLKINYCPIRVKEWVKNIDIIMSKRHEKGEGERMAEEIINYMQKSFMGGM